MAKKTAGVPLRTSHAIVVTHNGESKTAMLFFANDDVAAAKVARAYTRTLCTATKNATTPLTKGMFRLLRHHVGI